MKCRARGDCLIQKKAEFRSVHSARLQALRHQLRESEETLRLENWLSHSVTSQVYYQCVSLVGMIIISKCLVDTSHIPRWGKKTANTSKCIIVNCDKQQITLRHCLEIYKILMMTQQAGLQFDTLSVPTLLCNSHYHVLYNIKNPTETNCSTCSVSIRNRTCPDPEVHMRKKTGFEGKICPDSIIMQYLTKKSTISTYRWRPKATFESAESHMQRCYWIG